MKYNVGDKKGKLNIIGINKKNNVRMFDVICDCGTKKTISINNIYKTDSCGCLQIELSTKHGMASRRDKSTHAMYDRWKSMVSRCHNKNNKSYSNYGGRGIVVCDRWLGSNGCANYYYDILNKLGPQPGPEYSLDRIDNDGMYEISNLRWATNSQQNYNRSNVIKIREKKLEHKLLTRIKDTNKIKKLPFDITIDDIVIPEYCPYLNIKLTFEYDAENNDSYYVLDMIDYSKGYVKENVEVLSLKANRLKYNTNKEELITFAKNILKMHGEG
jgi:hypothetical protein